MSNGMNIDSMLSAAMTALSRRQRVVANNIANIDTPGFKSSDVHFEQKLQEALSNGLWRSGDRVAMTNRGHLNERGQAGGPGVPEAEVVRNSGTTLRSDGNNVDIDQQMLKLSESAIGYAALARLASSRIAFMKSVISEGRR